MAKLFLAILVLTNEHTLGYITGKNTESGMNLLLLLMFIRKYV